MNIFLKGKKMKIISLLLIVFYITIIGYSFDTNNSKLIITPLDTNTQTVLNNVELRLVLGRISDVNLCSLYQPIIGENILFAEEISSTTQNKCQIIHYLMKSPDNVDNDGNYHFHIDSPQNIISLYAAARLPGYYETFRDIRLLINRDFFSNNKRQLFQDQIQIWLSKIDNELTINKSPKTLTYKSKVYDLKKEIPSMIVSFPEEAVEDTLKCYIDQVDNASVSMPLRFNNIIMSPALRIFPYDVKFKKQITIKVRPFFRADENYIKYSKMHYSVIKFKPFDLIGEIMSKNITQSFNGANEVWFEYQIAEGGIYYFIHNSPEINYER